MTFTGFPEEALDFYEGLEADNSRSYWEKHQDQYQRAVAAPMQALADELEPRYGAPKVFRPYRDLRFARDKSPYKTQAALVFYGAGGEGSRYLQISTEGLMVAGGMYELAKDQVDRYRAAVDDGRTGGALVRVVKALETGGMTIGGDELKRAPRGYPADHPRADLLRRKALVAWRQDEPARWFATREAFDRIVASWEALAPLNRWLARHVGASRAGDPSP